MVVGPLDYSYTAGELSLLPSYADYLEIFSNWGNNRVKFGAYSQTTSLARQQANSPGLLLDRLPKWNCSLILCVSEQGLVLLVHLICDISPFLL